MKDLINIPPEELLMPVTQHVMAVKINGTAPLYRKYTFESGLTEKWSKEKSVSDIIFYLSVYVTFLYRLTGTKDIVLLLNLKGRNARVPIRISVEGLFHPLDFIDYVSTCLMLVNETTTNSAYKAFDIGKIVREENKMVFTFIEEEAEISVGISDLSKDCDLGLCYSKNEKGFSFGLYYDSNAITGEHVERWALNIKKIEEAFLNNESRLSRISIISDDEAELYKKWNDTSALYEKDMCVHDKLILQAAKTPDKVALYSEGKTMTYDELNKNSDAFANYLISQGVSAGDRIAVCLDRGFELMVSVFGIIKTGAAYMPVSTKFPVSRIKEIIDDAQPAFIVTAASTSGNIPEGAKILDIDLFMSDRSIHDFNKPAIKVSPEEVAYIIYTSGTTGKPKGVMIEHHSVLNRIGWMQKAYPITPDDVLIQKTPVTFDVSVWELFWWSFVGAGLVLLEPEGERSPELILDTIKKHGVTVIHFVPSMFSTFLAYLDVSPLSDHLSSLRMVFCSGEALTTKIVSDFYDYCRKINSKAEVINLYGPTEATVDVSYFNCPDEKTDSIPIGKPIDNTQLYVVNESYNLQPLNMPGELLICGVNLARGYYNNERLTNEKFIVINLFGEKVRAYKTGDITYWSDDGNIYYIGRTDSQIKLRGMRIEIGEIESNILLCPGIKYCVVILVNPNTERSYLAAFYQTETSCNGIDSTGLKEFLKTHLPEYKIPGVFKEIFEIPLSINGKVDRKVLLSYLLEKPQGVTVSASSNNEKRIFEIWKRILKKESIDLNNNFFEIGGNSLLLAQLTILLKKEFKKEISALTIMQNPTIRMLAKFLSD